MQEKGLLQSEQAFSVSSGSDGKPSDPVRFD
jgi:hypothetical protein